MQSIPFLCSLKHQAVKIASKLNNVLQQEFPREGDMDYVWFNFKPSFEPTEENKPEWWSTCCKNKIPYVFVGINQEYKCYEVTVFFIKHVEQQEWLRLKTKLKKSLQFDGIEAKGPSEDTKEWFKKYNEEMHSPTYSPSDVINFLGNKNRSGFIRHKNGNFEKFKMNNICAYCNAGYGNNKPFPKNWKGLCKRCKQVQYCSRKCQRAHWSKHKKTCKEQKETFKKQKKKYKKEKKQHGKPAVTNTVLRFKDKESFAEWKRKNNKNLEFVEAVSIPVTEEIRGNLEPSKLSSSTNVVMGKIKRLDRVRVLRGETLECGIVDYVSDERIDYVVQGKKYTCDHNAVHSVSPYRGFTKGNSTNS